MVYCDKCEFCQQILYSTDAYCTKLYRPLDEPLRLIARDCLLYKEDSNKPDFLDSEHRIPNQELFLAPRIYGINSTAKFRYNWLIAWKKEVVKIAEKYVNKIIIHFKSQFDSEFNQILQNTIRSFESYLEDRLSKRLIDIPQKEEMCGIANHHFLFLQREICDLIYNHKLLKKSDNHEN